MEDCGEYVIREGGEGNQGVKAKMATIADSLGQLYGVLGGWKFEKWSYCWWA